jgi:hypothetical protein
MVDLLIDIGLRTPEEVRWLRGVPAYSSAIYIGVRADKFVIK